MFVILIKIMELYWKFNNVSVIMMRWITLEYQTNQVSLPDVIKCFVSSLKNSKNLIILRQ